MSHAEIWDDSALVNSWNEAVEEYKLYHSIHARNENVEEAIEAHKQSLEQTAIEGSLSLNQDQKPKNINGLPITDATSVPIEFEASNSNADGRAAEVKIKRSSADGIENSKQSSNSAGGGPAIPQHLIGSVHDEGLKQLLMSWYYAGYYTGLYEGQNSQSLR